MAESEVLSDRCSRIRACEDRGDVIVLLSGGVDSAACAHFYLALGRRVMAAFVDYGQAAANLEGEASRAIADHFNIPLMYLCWQGRVAKTDGLIPGRNAFLLAAVIMECAGRASTVAIGIHAGTQYDDCSPQFVKAIQSLVDVYCRPRMEVAAPFVDWTKADIWAYSHQHQVPLGLTYSCERGTDPPCGACLSCLDREALNARA